ncbi:sulfite exporter TauE/SafE family protein [Clostridium grantii]|uniref:Probable membrane transporter protein n=1 Tax=Clostridium grantii DSM 8605 TaxID=1121316 RepID=A0A1M5W099_9CLOT|nr:sulfite exporter TauE/SafE family protein [Clostridium grantii]SHH80897.1 hypothetical protein SAMN02745207_02593 [Clostridium grantii DSM 8605]
MYLVYFLVSLLASVIGGICGIGGGVIIKPVLDATGTMSVASVSFLSGCTVLSMSLISVFRNQKSNKGIVDLKSCTPLAIGAVIGGLFGKVIFDFLLQLFENQNHLGAVQAALLILVTFGTLLYSLNAKKIKTKKIESAAISIIIGFGLGTISSFLGIGGGPINLTVLFFFFSMTTKKAAANSLYIIMFSQLSSFIQSVLKGNIPEISFIVLGLMVFAGVVGGMIGGHVNKKISDNVVDKLFIGLMVVIIGINIFNMVKFLVI